MTATTGHLQVSVDVFADCTVKQAAVEPFKTEYDDVSKLRYGNDRAALLMMIHNQKSPNHVVIVVFASKLARIQQ